MTKMHLPVAHYFNQPTHSYKHVAVSGISLHHGNTKPQKLRTKIDLSNQHSLSPWNQQTLFIPLIYSRSSAAHYLNHIFPPLVDMKQRHHFFWPLFYQQLSANQR